MDPFIHIFLVDNEAYFYDVNRNEIIKISNESFKILEGIKNNDSNAIKLNDELLQLKEKGYLSEHRAKSIEHPTTNSLDTLLSRNLSLLTIQLTQNCNLRCSYCPYTSNDGTNRTHSNKSIDISTAQKAILFFKEHSVDSEYVTIGFYGGEPILEIKTLKEIVNYSKNIFYGKKVEYTITTNGTLLDNEMLKFLEENNFSLVFSMDGPQDINDINRKYAGSLNSVFSNVIDKINFIYKNLPKLFKSTLINMVIDPKYGLDVYENLFEQYEALSEIRVSTSILDDGYKTTKNTISKEFLEQYASRRKDYKEYLFCGNNPKKPFINMSFYGSLFLKSIEKLVNGLYPSSGLGETSCPSGQCIPGNTRLMVDVDGNFYPCERVSEEGQINIIGNVDNGLSKEKTNYVLNIGKNGGNDCLECFAIRYCNICVKLYEKKLLNKTSNMINECRDCKASFHDYLIEYIRFNNDYMEVKYGEK